MAATIFGFMQLRTALLAILASFILGVALALQWVAHAVPGDTPSRTGSPSSTASVQRPPPVLEAKSRTQERTIPVPPQVFQKLLFIAISEKDHKISPQLQEILSLSSDSVDKINAIVLSYIEKIQAVEARHSKVSRDASGDLTIDIEPFPAEGVAIRASFHNALASVLGSDGADAFEDVSARDLQRQLSFFGTPNRRIKVVASAPGEQQLFRVTDQRDFDGKGYGPKPAVRTFTLAQFVDRYGYLVGGI